MLRLRSISEWWVGGHQGRKEKSDTGERKRESERDLLYVDVGQIEVEREKGYILGLIAMEVRRGGG